MKHAIETEIRRIRKQLRDLRGAPPERTVERAMLFRELQELKRLNADVC